MKTVKRIVKCVGIYIIIVVICDLLFAGIYYYVQQNGNTSFWHVYLQTLSGKLQNEELGDGASVAQAVQKLCDMIASAILTGYVLACFFHREPKVYLPDKLVIRRRTSEGVQGQLALGIMVLNKGKRHLERVECRIGCGYVNYDNKNMNAEFQNVQIAELIPNFYRFSVPISVLPHKLLKDYSDKLMQNDYFRITLCGEYGDLGGTFRVSRTYKLSDIILTDSRDCDSIKKWRNPFTGKENKRINWEKLTTFEDIVGPEREKMENEIKEIANQKM